MFYGILNNSIAFSVTGKSLRESDVLFYRVVLAEVVFVYVTFDSLLLMTSPMNITVWVRYSKKIITDT